VCDRMGRGGGEISFMSAHQLGLYTVEPGYNDIGLYDTSHIASDIL
jgi:hypothetical protein